MRRASIRAGPTAEYGFATMAKSLTTTYLGLSLRSPLVVSACPLSAEPDTLKRMEAFGAAAAVMPSLFEEQIEHTETGAFRAPHLEYEAAAENTSYYRQLDSYNRGPDVYLREIEAAKRAVSIPIIGSLNGTTKSGWTNYAQRIQDAGADALELNMYYIAADPATTSHEIESRYLDLVAEVRSTISIPLAVKIGPYFTALAHMARRFADAGANGLVLFNRFFHPDIDLETGQVVVHWRYSRPEELLLRLRWIAILKDRVNVSFAATGGIKAGADLAKALLAGADVGMVASVLYQNGIDDLGRLQSELQRWLDQSEFNSLADVKGALSQKNCPNPDEFERALYAKTIAETSEGL
jgi:dihydroorotate dehydrogenase (fumarate)